MTTGLIDRTSDEANYMIKSWSGGDGKYTLGPGGKKVLNFHNYSMTLSEASGSHSAGGHYLLNQIIPLQSDVITQYDEVKAQAKFVSKVRDTDFNLGIALATGKQNVNLVVGTVTRLAQAALLLRRGDISSAAQRLGLPRSVGTIHGRKKAVIAPFNAWLQLQYGWLPLIQDVADSANALAVLADPPRRIAIRSTHKTTFNYDASASPSLQSAPGVAVGKVRYIYYVEEDVGMSRQLGLLDPLSIAWEVTPWSFVVDWFLPIGLYLDNLNIIPSLKGTVIKTTSMRCVSQSSSTMKQPYYDGSTTSFSYTKVDRVVYLNGSLPLERPGFKKLSKSMSGAHIANAVALAAPAFVNQLFKHSA